MIVDELRGWVVETCKGPVEGCANRAVKDDGLAAAIEARFVAHDFGSALRAMIKGRVKRRHEFRVAIADCPNACSRPQIADVGLIGAAEPGLTPETCHQCMGCVHACREGAVSHPGLLPLVDAARCLRCGACTRVCLSGTLQAGRRGWRLQVGGRLGRHPRLATELPGLHTGAGVVAALDCCLEHYLRHARAGERFGEVLDRTGLDELLACVAARGCLAGAEPARKPAPILRGPV